MDRAELTLTTPIQYVPRVGPRRAERFERLGIHTVADLVRHLPHRYEHHREEATIQQLAPGTVATARGTIAQCRFVPARRGGPGRFTSALEDETGRLEIVWFNGHHLQDRLHPGMSLLVTGKVGVYNGHRQMTNPRFQVLDDQRAVPRRGERYRPVYPATEDLPTDQIERAVEQVLPSALPRIRDHFDDAYRRDRSLPDLATAYRLLHAPADEAQSRTGRRRLVYDELLMLQLGFALKRQANRLEHAAPPLRTTEAIDHHIRQRIPFDLTDAQARVTREIATDLQRPVPMTRLLQGDVGSGKTVVALYAMLLAVASEKQAALMAPTELLAEQHYLSITDMLAGSTVRVALVTSSLTKAERQATVYRIEQGVVDIVIGTQALITESVRFADLALVVVDEQHRFGVVQRAALRSKAAAANTVPHTLVMTATPIPRTLSLTVFGDLDVSTIDALPPGRQPIATRVVGPEKTEQVYDYVARRLARGEQAYVVVPTIEDQPDLKAVRSHAQHLSKTHFGDYSVATLHGQQKRRRREQIMHRFRQGQIDVLIATTVIEVGVDVPAATVMVVEHAERFGLAQLHQLRGRVGRGHRRSLCVFIADPTNEDARSRMEAIAETTDGFRIAESDLEIRGMGELFGTRQAGLPPLRVARIPDDLQILQMARRDAQSIAETDPKLEQPEHELLRKRLLNQHGDTLGLADVA